MTYNTYKIITKGIPNSEYNPTTFGIMGIFGIILTGQGA